MSCESQIPEDYIAHGCFSTLINKNLTEINDCLAGVDVSKKQTFLKPH